MSKNKYQIKLVSKVGSYVGLAALNHKMSKDPVFQCRVHEMYNFDFTVKPRLDEIEKQANMFAQALCSSRGYLQGAVKTKHFNDNIKEVKDAYIYSYFCALYFADKMLKTKQIDLWSNSLIFEGHKVMLDAFRMRFIRYYDQIIDCDTRVTLSGIEFSDAILNHPIWKSSVEIGGGESFFNVKHNYVLDRIGHVYSDISVVDINYETIINPMNFPVGNMSYTDDEKQIQYLGKDDLFMDGPSAFWSTAICLRCFNESYIDLDDRFYKTNDIIDSRNRRGFEVEAITGYNPVKFSSTERGPGNDYKPYDPYPPKYDDGPKLYDGGPNRFDHNGGYIDSSNSNKVVNGDNNGSYLSKAASAASKTTSAVLHGTQHLLREANNQLSNGNIERVASIYNQIRNHKDVSDVGIYALDQKRKSIITDTDIGLDFGIAHANRRTSTIEEVPNDVTELATK